jgi:hypothetical protein
VTRPEEKLSKDKAKLRRKEERVKKITGAKKKKEQLLGGSESQLTRNNDHEVKAKQICQSDLDV